MALALPLLLCFDTLFTAMFTNYLKTAIRHIFKNKFYAAINIAGLTIGLVIGLFILLWVQDELSFDRYNKQAGNIYHIGIIGGTGPSQQIFTSIIAPAATFAKNELPEVKDALRINNIGEGPVRYKDKIFIEQHMAFTDPSFFRMLDFPLINGNNKDPFPSTNSIVLAQSTATKLFGKQDPTGKTIILNDKYNFTVSGVFKDAPANSSFNYKVLIPLAYYNNVSYVERSRSYAGTQRLPSMDADWVNFSFETYLLLKPGTNIQALTQKLRRIHERQKPDDAPAPYLAQPLTKMHLYKVDGSDGGIKTVKTFGIVAFLILLIASINYVNLSTARSMLRAKEVSMRKIIGAGRAQLFIQFIIETLIVFLVSALLAVTLMYLLLPQFNSFSGKQIVLNLSNYRIWISILVAMVGTLAASGIYPAMLLSSFEPLKALKGKITAGMSNATFRKVLVVVQFSISVVLIIGTLVIGNQLKFIRNKNLGYNKENVLSVQMREDMVKHFDAVRADLLKQPGIVAVTRASSDMTDIIGWTGNNDWDGKLPKSNLLFHQLAIDKDFTSFFNMKLVQGNSFTGSKSDSVHFIVNETAVNAMGIKDPIGKNMRIEKIRGNIIGVVKDFNYTSMHKKIEPMVMFFDPANGYRLYVKTTAADAPKAIEALQQVWKQYNNQVPLNYTFLDESFARLYSTEQHTASLFNIFSAVTITLSCLGLFGLATYTAQVKTREIGIRKVFGASVTGIIRLMAAEFMILVVVSLLIATPVAWYGISNWLMDFAYRTNLAWWIFALAGAAAISIAFITISFQSVKAALANPIKSLRNE